MIEDNFHGMVEAQKADFLDSLHDNKVVSALQDIKVKSKDLDMLEDYTISEMLVEISSLMISLGVIVSEAKLKANEAYSYRKWRTAHDFRKIRVMIDKKIGDAENEAVDGLQREMADEIIRTYQADTLETFYNDMDRYYRALSRRMDYLSLDFKKTK